MAEESLSEPDICEVDDPVSIASRRLFVFGEIDDGIAQQTIVRLHRYLYASKTDPVFVYINSDGGSVEAGYAIIDTMLAMPYPVVTIIAGRAFSMAAVIAAYGTRGHRYIMPRACAMLHPVLLSFDRDNVDVQHKLTEFAKTDWNRKVAELASRMSKKKGTLSTLIDKGLWMNAREAIKNGLVDGIWEPKDEQAIEYDANALILNHDPRLEQFARIMEFMVGCIRQGKDMSLDLA